MAGSQVTSSMLSRWCDYIKCIHWLHVIGQVGGLIYVLTRWPYIPLRWETFVLTSLYGTIHGYCITIGYHRLWAHKTFRAHVVVRFFLAVIAAGVVQRPIIWWVQGHRAHHRYIDTDRDPYNARRGLFYSHMGWLLLRQDTHAWDVDISDLLRDPIVVWQDRYYIPLSAFSSFVLPTLVAGIGWGDWRGGFFWAGMTRLVILWHLTFTVNSLAHWAGSQPFSKRVTARNNVLVAIIAGGEGYHNFHHAFPFDYRNGVRWYDLDSSKWIIWLLAKLRLATSLNRVTDRVMENVCLQPFRDQPDDGGDVSTVGKNPLPVIEWEEYVHQTRNGRALVAIAGSVYDVTDFLGMHPGGEQLLRNACGKDATALFHGGIYDHSVAAHDFLSTMRVYVVHGGGPVEILQRNMHEKCP